MSIDTARLSAIISPLRRALLATAREEEGLPDIPDPQIEILRALPRGVRSSPGALAHELSLGRSTISNLLASMERADLIERRPRSDDRRQVEVVASAHALSLLDRFDSAAAAVVSNAAQSLSLEDVAALDAALPALESLHAALTTRRISDAARREEVA